MADSSSSSTSINPGGTYLFHPHGDDDFEIFTVKPGQRIDTSDRLPVLHTNIGFISSKIELHSNVEAKCIAISKRGKRFTGRSSYEVTVIGSPPVSLDRESRWGTSNRVFNLYDDSQCRVLVEYTDFTIENSANGRVLATYKSKAGSTKKDGILTLSANDLEKESVKLVFMVVLVVSMISACETKLIEIDGEASA